MEIGKVGSCTLLAETDHVIEKKTVSGKNDTRISF